MRKDVEFQTTDGTVLRGWRYTPPGGGPFPTIVMAHGFAAVKEMHLDDFAEVFASAGFAAIVYDNRGFGASDGQPREEIDPWLQVRDYSDAITFAQSFADADQLRIGVWGSSYSGGHVLAVAAIDKRVRCVVSQVPAVSGWANFRRLVRADLLESLEAMFAADRQARAQGQSPTVVPIVNSDPTGMAALPTADSLAWFMKTHRERAPAWRNEVTLRSLEYGFGYEPGVYADKISPTPLLMIVALKDSVAVTDLALKTFEQAVEPKRLVLLKGGHFDAYVEEFETASIAARAWFIEHLI